ncbi:MAG: ABC transporter permease [Paludibacteraceae bacterium]|nr:ABC transporter permease [Paludibacteraceae bacterium]
MAFLAKRLYYSQQGERRSSRPAVRVALAGIVIGMTVMIATVCIVKGFKQTVADKVAGFSSHIQVVNFDNNNTYEMQPVAVSDSLINKLSAIPHVVYAEAFATKPGIIKTDNAFQGVVFKGLAPDFDGSFTGPWDFFKSNLVEGRLPEAENEVVLSRELQRTLLLQVGEPVYCYFVEEQVRARKLIVTGIYETGFMEYDRSFIIGNINVVRRLNGWSDNQASGIEIRVDRRENLDYVDDRVFFATANRLDEDGNAYYVQNLMQQNPAIFSWLDLLDMNMLIIIILMLCVAGFNMISGLIILILDSVPFIGTMKSLGMNNRSLRAVFLVQATLLIGRGLLWGNIIGLGLCAIQYFTHLVPLDATTYYVNYVPVAFDWPTWLLLNIGTLIISVLILLLPSAIVARISPAQVMRFE